MPRVRKFIGLWIALIVLGILFPGGFYLLSRLLDNTFGVSGILNYPANTNLLATAFFILMGLFWLFWAYSFLHFVGKGSPVEAFGIALQPTEQLVISGPYAYTRNPMLFGMLMILLAVALWMESLSGLLLVPVFALLAIIYIKAFEEPALVRRFGEEYMRYRDSVPILIPMPQR